MRVHETRTDLPPSEVIERARRFFTLASTPYAAFHEKVGDGYLKLFLEVGEVVIGTLPLTHGTLVRGSASRGEHLLTSFLSTLSAPLDVRQTLHRYGRHEERGALVAVARTPAPASLEAGTAEPLDPAA